MQLDLDRRHALSGLAHLDFAERLHLRIGEHFLRRVRVRFRLFEGLVQLDYRRELGMFARELAVAVHVAHHVFAGQQTRQLAQAAHKLLQFRGNRGLHRRNGRRSAAG